MTSSAIAVVPSEIFKELSTEEQDCSNAIEAKSLEVKVYLYSTLVFGILLTFGTTAIARIKPFNRMRVVQLTAFFSVIGSIVGFCARRYESLKEKLLDDTEENYGKGTVSQGLTVEQAKLIPRRNYYQKKFEHYSGEAVNKASEEIIVRRTLRVQAAICKVQVAYIQAIINNFSILSVEERQNPERFRETIFTFVTTPLATRLGDQDWVQDNQELVQFDFADKPKYTLEEIEDLRVEDIADRISAKIK
jgi:hypothetical protein